MPIVKSPYKPKARIVRVPRLLLSIIGAYLVFRSTSFVALFTKYIDASIISFQCASFDHGDTTSLEPSTVSMFNCNSPSGKCKWYFPAKFFDPMCGVGREYAYLLEDAENMRLNMTLWRAMPPVIIEWASLYPEEITKNSLKGSKQMKQFKRNHGRQMKQTKRKKSDPSEYWNMQLDRVDTATKSHIFPRHNISMVHVHKTGGTSLVFAFGRIHERLGYEGKMHIVYPQTGPKGLPVERYSKQRDTTGEFINGAVKYKSNWGRHEHTIFAVVRDPVERFISAIGQATGGEGSGTKSEFAHKLSKKCLKEETAKTMLTCFVRLVKTYGTWTEMHFTPMVVDISFSTMYKDVPVAIFPFNAIPALLEELDANPSLKRKNGAASGHRKNSLLTDMNIDDYEEESLQDLCHIYRIDVLFLWHLGYATRCDDLVSFT